MASAEPFGASVYQAIQSRNLRMVGERLGASIRLVTFLKLAPAPCRRPHTTPAISRVPSGTWTTSPSASDEVIGHRIAVGRIQRQRDEDIGDQGRHAIGTLMRVGRRGSVFMRKGLTSAR